jgi:hypothetical protein
LKRVVGAAGDAHRWVKQVRSLEALEAQCSR